MDHSRKAQLQEFCQLDCDRFLFLKQWLQDSGIEHRLWEIGPYRHWVLMPGGSEAYGQDFQKKILIAHYDRVENTPGANDNSASVFQLLQLAQSLHQKQKRHNCLIILTDGEELQQQHSLKEQGAYGLAEKLKKIGFSDSLMIILDLCGIGDTMVCGTSSERKEHHIPQGLKGIPFAHEKLFSSQPSFLTKASEIDAEEPSFPSQLEELILRFSRGKQLKQLQYYSDDLGFLAHQFSTLLISLLPWSERKYLESREMPPSWQNQHSMEDTVDLLENRSFRIMDSFLEGLGNLLLQKSNR